MHPHAAKQVGVRDVAARAAVASGADSTKIHAWQTAEKRMSHSRGLFKTLLINIEFPIGTFGPAYSLREGPGSVERARPSAESYFKKRRQTSFRFRFCTMLTVKQVYRFYRRLAIEWPSERLRTTISFSICDRVYPENLLIAVAKLHESGICPKCLKHDDLLCFPLFPQ
jgi:hypothetical protein